MRNFARLSLLLLFPINLAGAVVREQDEVSVRLRPVKGAITIAGQDIMIRNGEAIVAQGRGFRRFTFKFEKSHSLWRVEDADSSREIALITNTKVDVEGSGLRVDLRTAPGHVQLIGRGSKIDLVGHLPLESYLEGVVAGEVPADWPVEALKAQAVAARSFTVAKIQERSGQAPDWLFEATVADQVFDHERVNPRASDAVHATRGEVLLSSPTQVLAANYHADCGGTTDEPGVIWGGHPTKNGTAKDAYCAMKTKSAWRFVADLSDLTKKLKSQGLIAAGFNLANLSIVRKSSGGRALDLKAISASGERTTFSGERLRQALGYSDLKSTLFDIKLLTGSSQIEILGRGFGHGTGLCQWGARQMAASGLSYKRILHHYYPQLALGAEPRPRGVTIGANASP